MAFSKVRRCARNFGSQTSIRRQRVGNETLDFPKYASTRAFSFSLKRKKKRQRHRLTD